MQKRIYVPKRWALLGNVCGNPICQLDVDSRSMLVDVCSYSKGQLHGYIASSDQGEQLLIVPSRTQTQAFSRILLSPQGLPTSEAQAHESRWLRPETTRITDSHCQTLGDRCNQASESWIDQFHFLEERSVDDRVLGGLRPPQIGALYASLAHWTTTHETATVVMPTGTGKTETMMALLMRALPQHLLVVVPSSALRDQTALKFATLGVLGRLGVAGPDAQFPVVGRIEHRLASEGECSRFLGCCNVAIATMAAISECSDGVQAVIASECSHLFIDEGHHVPARTWERLRERFEAAGKPVLQFTATPFRNDGRHIGGRTIYNYPLRKAQEQGYFAPITFRSLWEYDESGADEAIARTAVKQLVDDLSSGFDHILMARAETIPAADHICSIYRELAPEYAPLLVHSRMSWSDRRAALDALRRRDSRIITCVDMLGEGFDLPQLKIAALHHVHKSLAITIQFVGRFSRTTSHTGPATVIANAAAADVEDALTDLYSRDSDWNVVLQRISEGQTDLQRRVSEFVTGFTEPVHTFRIENIHPKMSTVVYRTHCSDWHPHAMRSLFGDEEICFGPSANDEQRVAVMITRELLPVEWGHSREIRDVVHHLYILHWDSNNELLYINSTNNASLHGDLARVVAGEDVTLVNGEDVFRYLDGLNRPVLMNVGLRSSFSRAAQFSMYVGTDVKSALAPQMLQRRTKTNLFARGYRDGDRASVGCSYKGRVWSHQIAQSIMHWVAWCHDVGARLTDSSISSSEILEHVIVPSRIGQRPNEVPLAMEWSEYFLLRDEALVFLEIDGVEAPLYESDLEVLPDDGSGPIRFRVISDTGRAEYSMVFSGTRVEYRSNGKESTYIRASGRRDLLSRWFQDEPPVIRFTNNNYLIHNLWFDTAGSERSPYLRERIAPWDWSGTDLKHESMMKVEQGEHSLVERQDSIQWRVVKWLLDATTDEYTHELVFDDDGSGEAADVVAVKCTGDCLIVRFFHCKYAHGKGISNRVDDLYEVCGQAQRSVHWKGAIPRLFKHLKLREDRRKKVFGTSRFARGDLSTLDAIARRARHMDVRLDVVIVQPGLSRSGASDEQLDLLGATELYLRETYAASLSVIGSA